MGSLMRGGRKLLPILATLIALLMIGPIQSVDALGVEGINLDDIQTLADILEVALTTDKGIKAAGYQLEAAQAQLEQAKAGLWPQIQLGAEGKVSNAPELGMAKDTFRTVSGRVTWAQALKPNNDLQAGLKITELGIEGATIAQQQAVVELVYRVQSAYMALVEAVNGHRLAEASVAIAQRKVEIASEKLAAGVATPLDVLTAQNELLQAQTMLNAANGGVDLAVLGLLQIIGLDHNFLANGRQWAENLVATQDVTPVRWPVEYEEAVNYALTHRYDLLATENQVEMARINVESLAGKRDWKLSLAGTKQAEEVTLMGSIDTDWMAVASVSANKQWGEPSPSPMGLMDLLIPEIINKHGSEVIKDYLPDESRDNQDPWSIGLELSYTLGDGGAKEARIREADAEYQRAKLLYEGLVDSVSIAVFAAQEKVTQTWAAYQLAQSYLEQARGNLERMELLFELGSVTETELLDVDLMVRQAENEVQATGLTYELAKTELAMAIGVAAEKLVHAVAIGDWALVLN
ncbi:MAG: TolC family protein [Firmicutes bacterium]|nr:TolC family protein [Bacillota bacterium]